MRSLRILGVIVTILVEPAWSYAQPGKYSATIELNDIEMRAGPSWKMAKTGKLKKGEQVIVHHEDGAWVAILPPPNAMSWVNHRFIGEFDPNSVGKQNALIMAENVEVRVGQENSGPSNVVQVKLPRGTCVEIIGLKFKDATTTWYPITPPEGEYRWLPKQALGPAMQLTPPPVFVRNTATPTQSLPGNDGGPGTLTSSPPKKSNNSSGTDWDKAEQAEQSGNYALAEKMYTKCYQDMRQQNADPEQLLICYSRIIKCQDRTKPDAKSTPFVIAENGPNSSTSGGSSGATGSAWPSLTPATKSSPGTGQSVRATGNLRRANTTIDGKQAYALENARGEVLYYLTAGNGLSLDSYVNRQVELTGAKQVRGDVRGAEYMIVSNASIR